jgi:hypothetical protein
VRHEPAEISSIHSVYQSIPVPHGYNVNQREDARNPAGPSASTLARPSSA